MQQALLDREAKTLPANYKGRVLYRPSVRAGEYGDLALNLMTTCVFGCAYCYVPSVLQRTRADFVKVGAPRVNLLRALERDLADIGSGPEPAFLCFTCDPYQPVAVESGITRSAIEMLHQHGRAVRVLSKGGTAALPDLHLYGPEDDYGCTLTSLDPEVSRKWEPGAAVPSDRLAALRAFHDAGIPTWISLEPVIDPQATLEIIRQTSSIVDEYKVGKLNYDKLAATIDWAAFARQAVDLLESLGKAYYIKADLRAYLSR